MRFGNKHNKTDGVPKFGQKLNNPVNRFGSKYSHGKIMLKVDDDSSPAFAMAHHESSGLERKHLS